MEALLLVFDFPGQIQFHLSFSFPNFIPGGDEIAWTMFLCSTLLALAFTLRRLPFCVWVSPGASCSSAAGLLAVLADFSLLGGIALDLGVSNPSILSRFPVTSSVGPLLPPEPYALGLFQADSWEYQNLLPWSPKLCACFSPFSLPTAFWPPLFHGHYSQDCHWLWPWLSDNILMKLSVSTTPFRLHSLLSQRLCMWLDIELTILQTCLFGRMHPQVTVKVQWLAVPLRLCNKVCIYIYIFSHIWLNIIAFCTKYSKNGRLSTTVWEIGFIAT